MNSVHVETDKLQVLGVIWTEIRNVHIQIDVKNRLVIKFPLFTLVVVVVVVWLLYESPRIFGVSRFV